ncbi:MAG: D-alanyl-D-alanine carboxypeptidase family protein [Christensenellales bacterium]
MKGLRALALTALVVGLLSPVPALASDTYDPKQPAKLSSSQLSAQSAILVDAKTGETLFEKNADDTRFPASTTKIMTILLGIMMGDQDAMVTIGPEALNVGEGSSLIPLVVGEQIRFGDLLRMTMVASGNDGAVAIAQFISGSEANFVGLMNDAALQFGCTATRFNNAHGLQDENHYTSARDMARIAKVAMENGTFREIAALTSFTLPANQWGPARKKTAQNSVFTDPESTYYYPQMTGIKTGFTDEAGRCFVGAAEADGISLISVVLKDSAAGRWNDTKKLMAFGFAQYVTTSIEALYRENPKIVDISGFALDDPELGRLQLAIRKVDPLADDHLVGFLDQPDTWTRVYNMRTSVNFVRKLEAPVEAGETVGTMTYTPEGTDTLPVAYELIATRSILRRPSLVPSYEEIVMYTGADPNPFPRFSFNFLLLILSPLIAVIVLSRLFIKFFTRKKKPKLKSRSGYTTRYYR